MAEESKTALLYHTFVSDSIVKDGKITGVKVHNKNGTQKIMADRIIDCTGDGDVAARAGCGFDVGDEDNGDNLLVAGRCASCSHEALGSLRVMPQCGVMGQAAGAAAVISLNHGISPKEISVPELQKTLKEQDCIF
jgi:hypothetical protein